MAQPDDLTRLATRAKEAQTRVAKVREEARADLEQNVASARESAQEQADKLRQEAEKSKAGISGRLSDMQRSWNDHISSVREDLEDKRAKHDVHVAQRSADDAEAYASFATDHAYSAVVEAEYAALDAVLARMDADQMSEEAAATGVTGTR
jgi:vacuolar-type H+-ATPase subunit I/STV1